MTRREKMYLRVKKIENCCFSDSTRKKCDNSNETNPRLVVQTSPRYARSKLEKLKNELLRKTRSKCLFYYYLVKVIGNTGE